MISFPKKPRPKKPRKGLKRSRMKPLGHGSRWWTETRNLLKIKFEKWGITRCEFGYEDCTVSMNLSFAHAVKRRFLNGGAEPGTPEHIDSVALACLNCHRILDEGMSHEQMRDVVMGVIARRFAG